MKIGIVGFGAIAKRVYLPLYLDNDTISEIHVFGRDINQLKTKLKNYNFNLYDDFETMLEKVDCLMVHSATISHYNFIKTALSKHIPVYVDKPLTDDIKQSKELMEIAETTDTLLFVGYNRRYAPLYNELKAMQLNPYKIHYEKHRGSLTLDEDYQTAIIDDFIHVIDTVVDFNNENLKVRSAKISVTDKDELVSLYVDLSTDDQINTLFTTRGSGNDYEKVTIHADDQIVTVDNMRILTILKDNQTSIIQINERLSDSQIRGFEATLTTFFNQIKDNHYTDTKQMNSEIICLEIIDHLKSTK